MKRVAIIPQQVHIAAPMMRVLDAITTLQCEARPGRGRSVSLISREGSRMVVAFAAGIDQRQAHIVKEVLSIPPDRVTYRHLSGPFTNALEKIQLRAARGGTEVLLTAEFETSQDVTARLLKLALEHAARDHLRDLKATVEDQLARPLQAGGMPSSLFVEVPVLASEQELLSAVEQQEEAEWGHVGHGRGVERVAVSLAEAVMLPARQVEHLRRAAQLHDVGKVALHSSLWGTRGTLSPEARSMMEAHPRLGYDLAARAGVPEPVLLGILHHHERWDGQGYPDRLAGEEIPLRARILFLAETVDSMLRATYRRPPLSPAKVIATLESDDGHLWDPMLARRAARIIRGKPHTGQTGALSANPSIGDGA